MVEEGEVWVGEKKVMVEDTDVKESSSRSRR